MFIGIIPPVLPLTLEWSESNIDNSYFINGDYENNGTLITSTVGDYNCTALFEFCKTVNLKNWAYGTNSTNEVVNGNTEDLPSSDTTGIIILAPSAPLETTVIGFYDTLSTISCQGGLGCECEAGTRLTCVCRCADRKIYYGTGFKEIQVFDSEDTLRSVAYNYN